MSPKMEEDVWELFVTIEDLLHFQVVHALDAKITLDQIPQERNVSNVNQPQDKSFK